MMGDTGITRHDSTQASETTISSNPDLGTRAVSIRTDVTPADPGSEKWKLSAQIGGCVRTVDPERKRCRRKEGTWIGGWTLGYEDPQKT